LGYSEGRFALPLEAVTKDFRSLSHRDAPSKKWAVESSRGHRFAAQTDITLSAALMLHQRRARLGLSQKEKAMPLSQPLHSDAQVVALIQKLQQSIDALQADVTWLRKEADLRQRGAQGEDGAGAERHSG
jgi:hypothetical protein